MGPRPAARRPHRTTLALALTGLALSACARRDTRPGPVVVYLVDTVRADRVSVYGSPRETTPELAQVAPEAVVYETAYSHASWTRPAVATLLTSLYPAENGAVGRNGIVRDDVPYLPALLKARGFETAAFVSNGNVYDPRLGFPRGFDLFLQEDGGGKEFTPARLATDPAVEYIGARRSPGFFLYVHVVDPHLPYKLDPPFDRAFSMVPADAPERDRRLLDYDRAILQADASFGKIVSALKRRGWWERATVVYLSDHGEEFAEHGGYGHGWTLFEEAVRVPLVVKFPRGSVPPGRARRIVTLADVTPTIAAIAGAAPDPSWHGRDLRSVDSDRPVYFSEELDEFRLAAYRRGDAKAIEVIYGSDGAQGRVVYDLAADPGEKNGASGVCGAPPPAPPGLFDDLHRAWDEEVSRWSQVEVRKEPGEAVRLDVKADLSGAPRPFLGYDERCEFAGRVAGGRLEIERRLKGEESFRLRLAANDGVLPPCRVSAFSGRSGRPIDLSAAGAPVRIASRLAPQAAGAPDETVVRNLRALGYLRGPGKGPATASEAPR